MLYVDIDGVLADLTETILDYIGNNTGVDLTEFEIHNYDFFDDLSDFVGVDVNNLLNEFANSEHMHKIKKINNANYINHLYNRYEVAIITARPEKCKEPTIEWLRDNYILYDKLFFEKDKYKFIERDSMAELLIEDNGETALKVADIVPVFLLDKSYNKFANHYNLTRVSDWNEIRELLI